MEVDSDEGGPRLEFIERNQLTLDSTPADWFNAFLPTDASNDKKFSTKLWCRYTNQKVAMANAGTRYCYPSFKDNPFTPSEIERHIGLYFLNGLSPSPSVDMKFKNQTDDPVNGNDMVHRIFGPNAEQRHKIFKAFLCVQDPMINIPPRKENPFWKVSSFLTWIQQVSVFAWSLGKNLAGDEQTLSMQGMHPDKLRITFKKAGDGFMCDAICEGGYTFTFYFRNMPPPKPYIDKGWSPLHARMFSMFESFQFKNHNVWMDNLYLSAKFAKGCFKHDKQINLAGVTRKGGRGIPNVILQMEANNKNELRRVRGTCKAAVLKGDDDCPDLLAVSIYDSKPVYFLSMIHKKIEWVVNQKDVFSRETNQKEPNNFLRLNINTDYNFEMHHVDRADQLREHYRFDRWMRKRKWWWSVLFWGMGVLMVNAYVCYLRYHLMNTKKKKSDLLSHYEFRRQIALAWIDPEKYYPNKIKLVHTNRKRNHDCLSESSTPIQTRLASAESANKHQ